MATCRNTRRQGAGLVEVTERIEEALIEPEGTSDVGRVRDITVAVSPSHAAAILAAQDATLKRETLGGARRFDGARACRLTVFRWTTRYNTRRRHSANGQQAPIAYEQQSATLALAA